VSLCSKVSVYLVLSCLCPGASPRKPFECDSGAAADIVLLVDGSWSIGRTNFRRVRDFLEGLITPFHIGPDRVQIGERPSGGAVTRITQSGNKLYFNFGENFA